MPSLDLHKQHSFWFTLLFQERLTAFIILLFWFTYACCKSTNFGVLLYLANCVSSLIFVAANIYVDRTLHRRAAGETPNLIAAKSLYFEKRQIL